MTMMCVRCYLEGRRVPVGVQINKEPPFSFMVYEGESRCVAHIPAPAVVEAASTLATLPDEFPALEVVREPVQTDNRFVVEDGSTPKKAAAKKRTPAKKAAAKKTQQRKRIKS